jgi:hypothetical protein
MACFFLPSSIRATDRRAFANKVCDNIAAINDRAIDGLQNDGSDPAVMEYPGAARFVAQRYYATWSVVFDWRDGKTHQVTIHLPEPV